MRRLAAKIAAKSHRSNVTSTGARGLMACASTTGPGRNLIHKMAPKLERVVCRAGRERPSVPRILRALLPRRNLRNLLVLSGLLLLLFAVERVGQRADFATYCHGWPFAYLVRDYRQSAAFQTAAGYYPPNSQFGGGWPALELGWKQNGLPIECERLMNPWTFENVVSANLWLAVPDALVGLLIAMIAARLFERRMRAKPLFQVRLRTAIGLLKLSGIMCAEYASWRYGHEQDLKILAEIKVLPPEPDPYAGVRRTLYSLGWHPPIWLPQGIAKIPAIAPWFERADGVDLDDVNPESLDRLACLPYLKSLTMANNGANGDALQRIARLKSIESLDLYLDRCTADGLSPLTQLPKLKRLKIDGFAITDDLADQLNGLPSLEEIEIGRTQCSRISLHGHRNLRTLLVFAMAPFRGRTLAVVRDFRNAERQTACRRVLSSGREAGGSSESRLGQFGRYFAR